MKAKIIGAMAFLIAIFIAGASYQEDMKDFKTWTEAICDKNACEDYYFISQNNVTKSIATGYTARHGNDWEDIRRYFSAAER